MSNFDVSGGDNNADTTATDQPAPLAVMTPAKLGMWIFISTEIMLFTAIVATYLIFRLSARGTEWPSPNVMHTSITLGVINTLLLALSGVAVWRSCKAANKDQSAIAKTWLIAAIVLGTVFLGIKSWEYVKKFRVGLLPIPGQKQMHDQADYQYLANVNRRMKSEIAELELLKSEQGELALESSHRLEKLYFFKQYMVDVTSRYVGRTASEYYGQLSIKLMAWQIYPHTETERNLDVVLEPEFKGLRNSIAEKRYRLELIDGRKTLVEKQVADLETQTQAADPATGTVGESRDDNKASDWLAIKQQQLTALEIERKRLENQILPLQKRVDNLRSSMGEAGTVTGINERDSLRLPVVIPNGQAWISCYILLTGAHAVHLIGGLLALLWWLPRRLDAKRSPSFFVTCMYWQFVDAVWLSIFWLIYF